MSNFKKSKVAKITTGIVGALTALAMAGGVAVLPAFAADDLAAQIAALLAQIQVLQAKLATQGGTTVGSYNFSVNLTLGSKGTDVMNLQKLLNESADTLVSVSGAGSKGNETSYFGPATKAAVMKFQTKYGISPVAGYVGSITRAKLNTMGGVATVPGTPTTPGTPSVPATAGTLVVTAASQQPANALAPLSATRIAFTKFTVTAGSSDVPLSSVTVERTGQSIDSALDSIVLVDENGDQIGISRTLNSVHRATVGDPIVIKAGTSRTFVIGANRPATAVANTSGTTISLDIVAINTTAAVVGDMLPIRGASHTINDNLTIGSVTMLRGSIDPGSSATKEIGTTGYTFSSVKITAGSAEALTLKSIRWNQVGSAGISDLANLKTYVDGVAYDAVSTDGGKYYTSLFGNGILIDKGFSKDISIKGDIIGGSSRTLEFSIAKRTDINVIGNIYGYGILPPQTSSCTLDASSVSCFRSVEDPWYRGSLVTMSNGTMSVSSDSSVSAQNIAVNLSNQPLGGWSVEVRGEPISVSKMIYNVSAVSAAGTPAEITNVSLVDQNGSILAGPVDGSGSTAYTAGTFTFTDAITFPVGVTKLALKGKLGTDFISNDTVTASTTPSGWTTVKGQVTGNAITPTPSTAITGNQMTVKAGAISVSVSSQPVAQNVIAGAQQYEFARYVFDAGQSGEDIRVTSIPLYFSTNGTRTDLTNCQLLDGSVSVTSGSNKVNPATTDTASSTMFTFDGNGFVVSKGTSKTLSLKCDVKTGVTTKYWWGIDSAQDATSFSGMTSGQTISEAFVDSNGQVMTATGAGSYTVAIDSNSTYQYRAARAGTEVALGAFRFTASVNEDMTLKQVALALGETASNSPADLLNQEVQLYDGSTKIGVGQFSVGDFATSSLLTPLVIPKGTTKTIVVKGTLAVQDSVNGTPGAFLKVNYDGDNNGLNGNYATGNDSGSTISGTSADVTTNGIRIFANVPTITVTSTGGVFQNNVDTYKFVVSNPGNKDMALKQVTFAIATTGGTASSFTLYADGVAVATAADPSGTGVTLKVAFDATNAGKIIPANSSKTYILKCASLVDTASVSETLSVSLKADTANIQVVTQTTHLATSSPLLSGYNTVWSPMSTTTLQANTAEAEGNDDWTNGYGLPGFPSVGSDFPVQVWTRSN